MAFIPKAWQNDPSQATPLDAAGQIDQEVRLSDYSDAVAAGGILIDQAEITSPAVVASGTTVTDVPGMNIDVPISARPFIIVLYAPWISSSVDNRNVNIWISDGTQSWLADQRYYALALDHDPLTALLWRPAPVAAKNYKMRVSMSGTGSVTVSAGTATTDLAAVPALMMAFEL